jgi:hypothetical protein
VRERFAALIAALPATAQTTANRNVEPIVLTGAKVPAWSGPPAAALCTAGLPGERSAHHGTFVAPPAIGVPVNEIVAYRWDGTRYKEIPVQVDQLYPYCLSNENSETFGQYYSGTDLELTYAWDTESWKKTAGVCSAAYPPGEGPVPDPVPTLDNDDEIVFLAKDAGRLQAPPGALLPAGATSAQSVVITDPLDPATVRYVYLSHGGGVAGRGLRRRLRARPDAGGVRLSRGALLRHERHRQRRGAVDAQRDRFAAVAVRRAHRGAGERRRSVRKRRQGPAADRGDSARAVTAGSGARV